MGFLDFLKGADINSGVDEFKATPGALLLDVRTPQEYRSGHIPGSENVPLQVIDGATGRLEAKDTPVFVYCQSGGRSSQAAAALKRMGYSCVKNIGGIASYSGTLER